MEKFLGVLFCGGKGVRLGEITKYTSKSFLPVYDTPVFKFGLKLLENSKLVNKIIIVTNRENNELLSSSGYETIIQDDSRVNDMFSGWEYVKDVINEKMNGVLVPSDNICKVKVDDLIKKFNACGADFLFSLHIIKSQKKLSTMGSFDTKKNKFYYKNHKPYSKHLYGVIAPYIIKYDHGSKLEKNIFESESSEKIFYKGYWFDIGDYESLLEAGKWRRKNKLIKF